jgi:ribosomal protein S18 acetylase RimI-like enzyme
VAHGLTAARLGVELRPVAPEDSELLRVIYRSTREQELDLTPWSEEQKTAFIEMQFTAQDTYYRQIHPDGRYLVILRHGTPVGRLYLVRLGSELRIVDIAILPEHRGAGIGTALLEDVIAEAEADGIAVSLHVEPWSPAKRLYERHGFVSVEVRGVYELMERPSAGQLKTAS